jgi:hypothetical protein
MSARPELFRMTHDIKENIAVALDLEVKAPSVIDSGFVVFPGPQRGVPEVLH